MIPGGVNISQIKLSSYVVDPIYYVICAIRRNDLDPEDWPIERHETDRSGRELVLLMTKEEIASPPGSDAHRNRTHPTGREDTRAGHQEM